MAWDIVFGDHFDLRSRTAYRTLVGWITSGLVKVIWFGTPCEGFSRARRGPPGGRMPCALRSSEFPRGLPDLPEQDAQKLALSNFLGDKAGRLQQIAYDMRIPGGEENPASSFLWLQPERQKMQERSSCRTYTVDYCYYGTPWRARTRMHIWHTPESASLQRARCHGRGICEHSGRPHLVLSGASSGAFLTKRKNNYPPKMCQTLAALLQNAASNFKTASLWQKMK